MNEATITGLFVSVFAFGTLLYLAALGEMIAEKSGVLNLGVEGMMAMGGMTAFWVGVRGLSLFDVQLVDPGNAWIALLVAGVVGAILASIHGVVSVVMGADQVVSGLALTIFGLGMAAFLGEDLVIERPIAEFTPLDLGPLSSIRFLGPVIFEQPAVMWLAIGSGVVTWAVLARTRVGLGLRAVGESAATADAAGQPVVKTRLAAVAIGGMFAGFAGAYLTLFLAKGWTEGTVAGRGWIAVALVIFGAWNPVRVGVGALLFGGLLALEPRLQTFGVEISPILLSMLPYVLTIAVLVALSIRSRNRPSAAPAAIGLPYRREER